MTFMGKGKEKLVSLEPVSSECAVDFLATRAKLTVVEAKRQVCIGCLGCLVVRVC